MRRQLIFSNLTNHYIFIMSAETFNFVVVHLCLRHDITIREYVAKYLS